MSDFRRQTKRIDSHVFPGIEHRFSTLFFSVNFVKLPQEIGIR